MTTSNIYLRSFILLLVLVTVAFLVILLPFYGALFWGAVLAVIFTPVNQRLVTLLNGRRNLAAFITLLLIILIVLIPVGLVTASIIKEGLEIYQRLESGEFNLGRRFGHVMEALPAWIHSSLHRLGIGDVTDLREKLSSGALGASKFLATRAVSVGQNTFGFMLGMTIMLYLVFFLLRDGLQLAARSRQVIPLSQSHQRHLTDKFTTVVRATVKGNIAVAAIQGLLGGIIFWILDIQGALLWGAVMGVLSFLPAVGASLVWAPVAIYFLATGALWQGIVLTAFGVLIIGLADNVLRPVLVGKDTKLPDYVILISTIGGIAVFGLNGFVIGPLLAALFVACWDLLPSALQGVQTDGQEGAVSSAAGGSAGLEPAREQATQPKR